MSEEKRPLLEVKNLRTFFKTKKGIVKAVNDVSYEITAWVRPNNENADMQILYDVLDGFQIHKRNFLSAFCFIIPFAIPNNHQESVFICFKK